MLAFLQKRAPNWVDPIQTVTSRKSWSPERPALWAAGGGRRARPRDIRSCAEPARPYRRLPVCTGDAVTCSQGTGIDEARRRRGRDRQLRHTADPRQGRRLDAEPHSAARRAGVGHLVHVSIVGIDRIPLPYYQTKLRVEEALEAAGIGHTVLRATQFHDLINTIFSIQRYSPVLWALRDVRFQPIDTRDVAGRLVELIDCRARGPGAGHRRARRCTLMRSWHGYFLAAHGGRRKVVRRTGSGTYRCWLSDRVRTSRRRTPSAPSGLPTTSPPRNKVCSSI